MYKLISTQPANLSIPEPVRLEFLKRVQKLAALSSCTIGNVELKRVIALLKDYPGLILEKTKTTQKTALDLVKNTRNNVLVLEAKVPGL